MDEPEHTRGGYESSPGVPSATAREGDAAEVQDTEHTRYRCEGWIGRRVRIQACTGNHAFPYMVKGIGAYLASEDVRLIPKSENMTTCDEGINLSVLSAASGEALAEVRISPMSDANQLCAAIVDITDDDEVRSKECDLHLIFGNRRLDKVEVLSDAGVSNGDIVQCLRSALPPPTSEKTIAHRQSGCRCRGRCTVFSEGSCCVVDAPCTAFQGPMESRELADGKHFPCQACWDRHLIPVAAPDGSGEHRPEKKCSVEGCTNYGNYACAGRCNACAGRFGACSTTASSDRS